ncbi:MAG TPA: hypothetical protein VJM31_08660 [Vicinamibacterales bacterium]|nr:hypothetical protein [Vicinamibacterales bacterium]
MATAFDFEGFLRNGLGLPDGSRTILPPLDGVPHEVGEWIEMGGELEDAGEPAFPKSGRYYNHFHDPLRPWATAGLTSAIVGSNESSVRWMQNPNQAASGAAGGNWSWHDARRMYYQSLTEPDRDMRNALLAATFRSIGQMMHLVVDASNPDHARNDPHPLASVKKLGYWNYDKWMLARHTGNHRLDQFVPSLLANPIGFDPSILQIPISGTEPAKVPIARLIDSDTYHGGNPWVTFNATDPRLPAPIGLSEISNANFFSEDTLEAGYPNPRPSTVGLIPIEMAGPQPARDGRNVVRRYWTRPEGLGLLPANPARAQCAADAFFAWLVKPKPYWCMDRVVWDQTGVHMLPRAVGYARGVLEYFFRGSLRVVRANPRNDGLYLDFINTSSEQMDGVFEVYARYEKGSQSERRERVAVLNDGMPIVLEPGEFARHRWNISATAPTPYYVLVFRGRLGLETDAVVPQVFAVPFVQVVQESYNADVTKSCGFVENQLSWYENASHYCDLTPVNHQIRVRLATNFSGRDSADPASLGISRIIAAWVGSASGPAPLTVNGTSYPTGIWTQGEDGTHPDGLSISDPAARGESKLFLTIHFTDPNYSSVSMQLATFNPVRDGESKLVYDNFAIEEPRWHLVKERSWRVTPNMPLNLLRPESIGGFPAWPTPSVWETAEEFVRVNTFGAVQIVKDIYHQPFFSKSAALEAYASTVISEPTFPAPPYLHWHVVIKELPLTSAGMLEFRRAFVSNSELAPIRFTMTAQEAP